MILPPVVRVFFAIDLSDSIKSQLATYIDSLRKISKSNQIRWSRPENLHITLQFLADVKSEHIALILEQVQAELIAATPAFKIVLRDLHLYPDPHRPRVIVVDIAPQAALARLSEMIGKGIQKAGYEIEKRAFRAHMTIGRIKTAQMNALSFLSDVAPPSVGEINIEEVVLFQSEPHPDGSHYIPLHRVALCPA